jgi:cob(I)alamin adenosyltransferase
MVTLNRIYTKTGDGGQTALGNGARVSKADLRIRAYGTVDETNAVLGVARLHLAAFRDLDEMLGRIQNDLFDVGADLCVPDEGEELGYEPLRMIPAQVERLEREIDTLNAGLQPLRSFVLPGGHPGAVHLHVCRTVCRRAEREIVALKDAGGQVTQPALLFVNRLSDFFFVASRWVNAQADGDVLWLPGKNR